MTNDKSPEPNPDTENNIICGIVDGFSTFVIAESAPVGGIAEVPRVAGEGLEAKDSAGPSTAFVVALATAVAGGVIIALVGVTWYAWRR